MKKGIRNILKNYWRCFKSHIPKKLNIIIKGKNIQAYLFLLLFEQYHLIMSIIKGKNIENGIKVEQRQKQLSGG